MVRQRGKHGGYAIVDQHLVCQPVALAHKRLFELTWQAHRAHNVRKVAAHVLAVFLEWRIAWADDLAVGARERLTHYLKAVDQHSIQVKDDPADFLGCDGYGLGHGRHSVA